MSCQSYSGVKPQLVAGVTVQSHTCHSHIQEYATAIHNVTVQSHTCHSHIQEYATAIHNVTVQSHTRHSHIQEYATAIHNVTVQSHICHSHIQLHHSHICYASHVHYTGVKPQPHAGVTVVTHMPQSHSGVKPQLYAGVTVTVTHMPQSHSGVKLQLYAGVTVTHMPQSHSGVKPQLYAGVTVTVTHMPQSHTGDDHFQSTTIAFKPHHETVTTSQISSTASEVDMQPMPDIFAMIHPLTCIVCLTVTGVLVGKWVTEGQEGNGSVSKYLNPPTAQHAVEILKASRQHTLVTLNGGVVLSPNTNVVQLSSVNTSLNMHMTLNGLVVPSLNTHVVQLSSNCSINTPLTCTWHWMVMLSSAQIHTLYSSLLSTHH